MPSKPKQPMPKLHKFDVYVWTTETRESAKLALLWEFAKRDKDQFHIYLSPVKKKLKK